MGGVVWSRTAEVPAPPSDEKANEIEAVEDENTSGAQRKKLLEEDMLKFKAEMARKREARTEAIQNLNKRIAELTEERDREREEAARLQSEVDRLRDGEELKDLRRQIEALRAEQSVKTEAKGSNEENGTTCQKGNDEDDDKDEVIEGLERQVKALKDVATIGGEMLRIRELQVNELKSKLEAIEETGIAYEKEVENMKKLRNLYEERARAMTISHQMELEREKSKTLAAETRQKIAEHQFMEMEEKCKEVEGRRARIEGELDDAKMQISDLKIKLAGKSEDLYNATSQLAVVNHLFGQLLSPGQDSLEKITKVLEDHHDLVHHLTANGKINDLASTLVEIADKDPLPTGDGDNDMSGHLTKVWRLLVELLGHHIVKPAPEEASPESCYKSVDTPSGPKLVISVSQTFLRLKDLILEKNSLMKEVGQLKDLNSTLESRLLEQESRLSLVTTELHTTWAVVNKLKRQHQNLHTNEQVLRYELAQKRLLLTDLKKQLEECRENWTLARAKNTQTERDWKLLRSEFALRKQQASSAESGYEESPTDSQDEDEWKEEKNKSVSSDEDQCELLSWNGSEEPRTERRGTLTDVSQTPQSSSANFTVSDVEPCMILPWTDPEESSADELSEDSRVGMAQSVVESSAFPGSSGDFSCCRVNGLVNGSEASERVREEGSGCGGTSETAVPGSGAPSRVGLSPEESSPTSAELPSSRVAVDDSAPSSSSSSDPASPGPSTSPPQRPRTAEEILQARQARLQRLEEGCKGLFNKMSRTNQRSEIIDNRLTELHEIYGAEDPRHRREQLLPAAAAATSEPSRRASDPATNSVPEPPTPPPFPSRPLFLPNYPTTDSDDSSR